MLHDEFYPRKGWAAYVYTGMVDQTSLAGLEELTGQLEQLVRDQQFISGERLNNTWISLKCHLCSHRLLVGGVEEVRKGAGRSVRLAEVGRPDQVTKL